MAASVMPGPEPVPHPRLEAGGGSGRRVLDPVERASEVLFGLIMVLTFTLSIGASEAGQTDVRAVLIGALGCNFAWGIIDAVMYLLGAWGERGLAASEVRAIQRSPTPEEAQAIISRHLPALALPALSVADLERIRRHLMSIPEEGLRSPIGRDDIVGAVSVFLLVFVCLFPVAVPFLLFSDANLALRVSNGVAVALLFATGFTFGQHVGRPWRAGLVMVIVGLGLVAVAAALGG